MDWTDLLSRFGFPVVCCIALGWYVFYQTKSFREELKEERAARAAMQKEFQDSLSELQKERSVESKNTIEALNNNTLAIQKLSDRLDAEGRKET